MKNNKQKGVKTHNGLTARTISYMNEEQQLAFWRKCDRSDLHDCWIWQGAKSRSKAGFYYGAVQVNGVTHLAHRVAYWITTAVQPAGRIVLHRCDNPLCVAPHHLFLSNGTGVAGQLENVADATFKRRFMKAVIAVLRAA